MITEPMTDAQKLMLDEVLEGLSKTQKTLPSKYFYDEYGSQLFDEITRVEEYYPTRTEKQILEQNIDEIVDTLGTKVLLIEPGSGNSYKTRLLLDNLKKIAGYIPMDISEEFLYKAADELQDDYPKIAIVPIQVDYTQPFELPDFPSYCRKIVFFPGSTIGNFEAETAKRFFEVIKDILGERGGFLIGVDLKKDIQVLEAAYNDSKEVTAAFNLNILKHINDQIGTEFDASKFRHQAIFNEEKSRIEMHLFALEAHSVVIHGKQFSFEEGESIHTENSHKYTLEAFRELVSPWFEVEKVWMDENQYFSLQYLVPKQ